MKADLENIFSDLHSLIDPDFDCPDTGNNHIDNWFNEIHLIDKFLALQDIKSFLGLTNRYKIPTKNRVYLLEKLTAPTCSLVGRIKPDFINTPLPLKTEHYQQIEICKSVFQQFVVGYLIILKEQVDNSDSFWNPFSARKKQVALTILRLIRVLSQITLTDFETYNKTDKSVWDKLYKLYRYAELNKLAEIQCYDPVVENKTTIKKTFLQILLLALVDPYHLNQLHTYYIYKHLANWSKNVKISIKSGLNQSLYRPVKYFGGHMPVFYSQLVKENQEVSLFIDTSKLTIKMLKEDCNESSGFLAPKIRLDLLNQLQARCSKNIEREFQRKKHFVEIKIAIGLRNVHYVLSGFKNPVWLEKANFSSIDISSNNYEYEQVLNLIEKSDFEVKDEQNTIHKLLTENKSQNGLSLIWINNYSINLKIGDVIAYSFEKTDQPDIWFIGVIRRIQHTQNQPLCLGIQQLSPHDAMPVSIKQVNQYQHYRAILLPKLAHCSDPETLLVEAMTFNVDDEIEVKNYNDSKDETIQLKAILQEEIETTAFYMRFRVEH